MEYLRYARKLADDIVSASTWIEDKLYLTGDLDEFSDGGFVLYFLMVFKVLGDEKYLAYARAYASFIYSKGISFSKGGMYYEANDLGKIGFDPGSVYPGFSHGTAGIGYIFAVLYEIDGQFWEINAAESVAEYIEKISEPVGDGRITPYLWHQDSYKGIDNNFYVGFCHGPAGVSLLFIKLYEITKNEGYLKFSQLLARGIVESGAPEYNSWGLWNSYNTCCGTPGLIEYFSKMYEITSDSDYLEYAKRSAIKVMTDSSYVDGKTCFYGYWDRTNPRDIQTYTGFYIGASGVDANLLGLYALIDGKKISDMREYSFLS